MTLVIKIRKRQNITLLKLSIVSRMLLNSIVSKVSKQTRRLEGIGLTTQTKIPLLEKENLFLMSHQRPNSNIKFTAL
jgi:hypothetical protein